VGNNAFGAQRLPRNPNSALLVLLVDSLLHSRSVSTCVVFVSAGGDQVRGVGGGSRRTQVEAPAVGLATSMGAHRSRVDGGTYVALALYDIVGFNVPLDTL